VSLGLPVPFVGLVGPRFVGVLVCGRCGVCSVVVAGLCGWRLPALPATTTEQAPLVSSLFGLATVPGLSVFEEFR
jgi:hypothetical protein